MGIQLCPPPGPGAPTHGLPVRSYRAGGFTCGRPVTGSTPFAQFSVSTYWWMLIGLPVCRSST